MSDIFVNFTTQYDGSYYCIIHDPQIIFINKNTKKLEPVIEKFLDFVFLLEKKQMNTYLASVVADDLPSGVYTFRIYRKNGLVPDINKDDLVSVGQTGWNKELKIQQNSNDIIGSISAYADKQDGIQRVSILMDSLQLGLVNNESGSVILDHDESAGSIKIKAYWSLNSGVIPNSLSIRGPSPLGGQAKPLLSFPISTKENFLLTTKKIEAELSSIILSRSFYVTIDTSSFINGRIGGYVIYTPSSTFTAKGSVSLSVSSKDISTGVSFRTR